MGKYYPPGSLRVPRGKALNRQAGAGNQEGMGGSPSPREGGEHGRANTETKTNLTCSPPSLLFHLRCKDEGNHVSTLYLMHFCLQMENTIKHYSYRSSNCHVWYNLPLERNVHLVFLPDALEITKLLLSKTSEFILSWFYDPIYAIAYLKSKHF